MKIFEGKNGKYTKLILSLVFTYIIIKLIDNIPLGLNKLSDIYSLLLPFIIAFVIAYALNPLVNLINKKTKLSRGPCIAITYLIFVSLFALAAFYILPGLYSTTRDLLDSLPNLTNNAQDMFNGFVSQVNNHPDIAKSLNSIDFSAIISTTSKIFNGLLSQIFTGAISLTTSIVNIVFGFLISIYILIDKDKFLNFSRKVTLTICGNKVGSEVINFVKILNTNLGSYIGIKAIDSAIIGVIAIIGLTLLNSNYVLLLAVIVGFTNMIPYFGPFIGMFVTFIVNLFVGDFKLAVITVIFLFILQQFDAWFLDPKLIGSKIGLPPFVVILAVTIGGAIYGPIGMIIATPIASVINFYVQRGLCKYGNRMASPQENNEVEEQLSK